MQSCKHVYTAAAPSEIDTSGAFLIGQDRDGHWLAVQGSGLRGGIFRDRASAVHYARDETECREGAILFVAEPLQLRQSGRR